MKQAIIIVHGELPELLQQASSLLVPAGRPGDRAYTDASLGAAYARFKGSSVGNNAIRTISDECVNLGFALVRGLVFNGEDTRLAAVSTLVGQPVRYYDQALITDVKPARTDRRHDVHAGVHDFPLHTDKSFAPDPPRFILFQCVSPDTKGGGLSVLSDARTAFARLDAADQQILLTTRIAIEVPTHIPFDKKTMQGAVVEQQPDGFRFRLRQDLYLNADDPVLRGALERFYHQLTQLATEIGLERDDLLVVDNHRVLHGRTALKAGYESERHLKRIYANPHS